MTASRVIAWSQQLLQRSGRGPGLQLAAIWTASSTVFGELPALASPHVVYDGSPGQAALKDDPRQSHLATYRLDHDLLYLHCFAAERLHLSLVNWHLRRDY